MSVDDGPVTMMRALRRRLTGSGAPVRATFVKLPATEAIHLVLRAGFDVAIVDLEHSQLSEREARRLVTHALALGLPAIVRVPAVDPAQINRLLEAGAVGVQLSMVRRRHQILDLVEACAYPPAGTRSINLAHVAAGFGATAMSDYVDALGTDGPLLIAQIETAHTDDPLDELLAGVDVAFCGTTDISLAMGVPGLLGSPEVTARVAEVATAADRCAIAWGAFTSSPDGAARLLADGARYVAMGADLGALAAGLRSLRGERDDESGV